jgi:Kef-type K+ transport system membrane component KefB
MCAAAAAVSQAVVIAAALSMSSSAFVLQLLSERGEAATKTGSATLGILLFQVRLLIRIP